MQGTDIFIQDGEEIWKMLLFSKNWQRTLPYLLSATAMEAPKSLSLFQDFSQVF